MAISAFRMNWETPNWHNATETARDPPLAAYGVAQSEELAKYFESLPDKKRPTAVFSSPFYRCLQTAAPVARALKLPLFVEHGIQEWYSPVKPDSGLHPRPANATKLQTYFPEVDASYSSTWLPNRLGETVEEVKKRTDGFLTAFIPRVQSGDPPPGGHTHILLISHAATCITLIKSLAGHEADGKILRIGCCTVSTLQKRAGTEVNAAVGAYHILGLGEGHFLKNGVERDWGFEDILVDEEGNVVHDKGTPGTEGTVEDNYGLQVQPTARM